MQVVTMASTKGGSGKSTLASCLAYEAAKDGPTWLLDLDPQHSLAAWWRLRGGPKNPALLTDTTSVAAALRKLGRQTEGTLIVDTPNSPMVLIEAAISDSDCIIIPMQPGPFDVLSSDAVNQIVVDCQAQHRTIRVVNRAAKRNPLVADAIETIKANGGGSPIVIEDRHQYQLATLDGKAGQEKSKPIREEIAKLWRAVKEVLSGR